MIITLTTDFGYKDPFVGIMKGVIAGINPHARVVDLSHGVPPQDVVAGALVLRNSIPYFPPDTIHVVVVDPGVGTARRPILIQSRRNYLIGPDNGVLSLAAADKSPDRLIHLSNSTYHRKPVSATFHGRDIFAPIAAYLSLGIDPAAFGETVEDYARITWPPVVKAEDGIKGEIVYIDGFGNLFTNIQVDDLNSLAKEKLRISLRGITVRRIATSYAAGKNRDYIAVINSFGALEIAVYKNSAQRRSQAKVGDEVFISAGET
jgi:S-adenosylmethionine hydrolase